MKNLPAELLVFIAFYLCRRDIKNFRLVSRLLSQAGLTVLRDRRRPCTELSTYKDRPFQVTSRMPLLVRFRLYCGAFPLANIARLVLNAAEGRLYADGLLVRLELPSLRIVCLERLIFHTNAAILDFFRRHKSRLSEVTLCACSILPPRTELFDYKVHSWNPVVLELHKDDYAFEQIRYLYLHLCALKVSSTGKMVCDLCSYKSLLLLDNLSCTQAESAQTRIDTIDQSYFKMRRLNEALRK